MREVPPRQDADWIYLCTPQHSGTHFVRFLLELHPEIDFWTCGRTLVERRSMHDWHVLAADGSITAEEFAAVVRRAGNDFAEWTQSEARRLGFQIPDKVSPRPLHHAHYRTGRTFQRPYGPTIITIRDPLLCVISALRRGSVDTANGLIETFSFLAQLDSPDCFWFTTDLWQADRQRALGVFNFLHLQPTREVRRFVHEWPALNTTGDGRFAETDRPELAEARSLAIAFGRVHPAIEPWAERIRQAGVQSLLERLGYRDLIWFE